MNSSMLPSRRIVGFVIIPLVTVFLLWSLGQYNQNKRLTQNVNNNQLGQVLDAEIAEYNQRDTDGDLLKDWEEFLYETDINETDTDGDGLDDYLEALDPIRDPLVADSELGRTQTNQTASGTEDATYYTQDASLTATEKFARDTLSTFAQLKNSDSIGTGIQDALIEKVNAQVELREEKQALYTIDDVLVNPNTGDVVKESYRKAFVKASSPLTRLGEYDLSLVALYAETNETEYLEELQKNAGLYQQFVDAAIKISVPQDIAPAHLEIINSADLLRRNIETMATADVDPLGALIASGDYRNDEIVVQEATYALALYFRSK